MLRLLELFSGIGAQRMALDRLGVEYKSVGISEISRRDGHVWVPPRPRPLKKTLRDVLEEGPIDREYYIQPDRMRTLLAHLMRNRDAGRGFGVRITDPASVSRTVTARQRREENETVIPAESARVPTIDRWMEAGQ